MNYATDLEILAMERAADDAAREVQILRRFARKDRQTLIDAMIKDSGPDRTLSDLDFVPRSL